MLTKSTNECLEAALGQAEVKQDTEECIEAEGVSVDNMESLVKSSLGQNSSVWKHSEQRS